MKLTLAEIEALAADANKACSEVQSQQTLYGDKVVRPIGMETRDGMERVNKFLAELLEDSRAVPMSVGLGVDRRSGG